MSKLQFCPNCSCRTRARVAGSWFNISQKPGAKCKLNIQCPSGYVCGYDPSNRVGPGVYSNGKPAYDSPGLYPGICRPRTYCEHFWQRCAPGSSCVNQQCTPIKKGGRPMKLKGKPSSKPRKGGTACGKPKMK